ncbi:MAG: hypothetical protein ACJ761_00930 [Chloroflexota bacterium]
MFRSIQPKIDVLTVASLLVALMVAAGCGSSTPAPSAVSSAGPAASAAPSIAAVPPASVAPSSTASRDPSSAAASGAPNGNVDRAYPELAVETDEVGLRIELTDPAAKAWRLVLSRFNGDGSDRLDLLVETGDVGLGGQIRSIVNGRTVGKTDLTGQIGDPDATAGTCHDALQVCLSAAGISVDARAGRLAVIVERIDPGSFHIEGATADWPGEPFILGPWRSAEPYELTAV